MTNSTEEYLFVSISTKWLASGYDDDDGGGGGGVDDDDDDDDDGG